MAEGNSKNNPEAAFRGRVGAVVRGKWHLDSLLGVGGMAAVYAASHRNGQRAALKILHAEFARDPGICERFLREAYVSNKVGHPATVKVLDDDVTEGEEPFLIMELLLGETVRDLWKKCGRTMPIPMALQIAERIADCLIACHDIGIIHRDLKPANVFVTSEGIVKVLDFGVAQMRDATAERTATGTALGTPSYMSPEQAMGLVDQLDGRADIFSVGAMLHALITGHRINNGRTEQEALVMAATKPVASVARLAPNLPIPVIKLIDKALAWDRRNRFSDARDLQRALTAALEAMNSAPLGPIGGAQERPLAVPPAPRTVTGQTPAAAIAPARPRVPLQSGAPSEVSASSASPGSAVSSSMLSSAGLSGSMLSSGSVSSAGVSSAGVSSISSSLASSSVASSSRASVVPSQPSSAELLGSWGPIELEGAPKHGPSEPVGQSSSLNSPRVSIPATGAARTSGGAINLHTLQSALSSPGARHANSALGSSIGLQPSTSMPPGASLAPDADPRVNTLRDMMKHVDRLLPTVRQYGWKHPATERTMRTLFEAFSETLRRDAELFQFQLRPYSFLMNGHTVWEPGPPFDVIPYNLFACGMRTLAFSPGIAYEELHGLFGLLTLDPGTELPPEDDLASAFWERAYSHIHYECCDAFAEGDAAEREAFFTEADELEAAAEAAARNHASRVEASAMNIATDDGALGQIRAPSVLALEPIVKSVLASELALNSEAWSERFVEVLVEGLLDAAVARDAQLMLAALRKSTGDLVIASRFDVVLKLYDALDARIHERITDPSDAGRLAAGVANALFGGESLELILRLLARDPASLMAMTPIFTVLSRAEFPLILHALTETLPTELRDVLISYVTRLLDGHEALVADTASGRASQAAHAGTGTEPAAVDPDGSAALVGVLVRAGTKAAAQALAVLTSSEDVNVRVEARLLSTTSESQATQEASAMLENTSPLVRLAAVRAVRRHELRSTWVVVARVVRTPQFAALGVDERLEFVRALVSLAPERGEPVAIELAKKGGIVASAERDGLRVSVCQVLGELSRSRATLEALNEVAQARWGTGAEVREAAQSAGRQISNRLAAEVRSA